MALWCNGLRQAGAIVVGKTNLSQLMVYHESDNPVYGRTNNPWNLDRTPGGSGGGEAAIIAAGGSPLGFGAGNATATAPASWRGSTPGVSKRSSARRTLSRR
jgi:fatty acid amide hydrolase